ncbi:hypothetical protein CORC01_10947 [Colletotrichum orchidophilum]|uniref:Uncharacterized protein n=1 Tax=Colletotrichum orchidophilum TaxID=1209926 RepID=A0A1G4AX35_9PEZI|nr:uncharacterized protein CORC01_10947 [Colletotrichum orchidophilum]OHE93720.1 hypothetical protein CORC01_10947 [Colletotrichum orchidophilum]
MCLRIYKHYTTCGCLLADPSLRECSHGPTSPLCGHQHHVGIVTRHGEKCAYHRRIARDRDRTRGLRDSRQTRSSIEDPVPAPLDHTREEVAGEPKYSHEMTDFQIFIKDLERFLDRIKIPVSEPKLKPFGTEEQGMMKKKVGVLPPLDGCSDWTEDDENDNALARRKRRERLRDDFLSIARDQEFPFDMSDRFLKSAWDDDNDNDSDSDIISKESSEADQDDVGSSDDDSAANEAVAGEERVDVVGDDEDLEDDDEEQDDMNDDDEEEEDDDIWRPEETWPPTGVEWTAKLKFMTGIRRN